MSERTYIAIDLKSYYASVECVMRNLDPLTTNLVVADESRTEKTICLAVSPSLKAYGIPGRARLFEVVQKVKEVNIARRRNAQGNTFVASSYDAKELEENKSLELSYIVAPPQMKKYMEISSKIYNIYLNFVSAEDIHVYSIDECFIDVTEYLSLHHQTGRQLCMTMIQEVLKATGITATGGIGTNMFLAKVAMDVLAKHVPPDQNGVRIAELDERSFRERLWSHEPLTDFWRIGSGTAKKLRAYQMYTLGDVARVSVGLAPITQADNHQHIFLSDGRCASPDYYYNEELLYRLFGVNAELLIDHAWGYEPTTIKQVKSYIPENNSISTGQVLSEGYDYDKALIIVREMTDLLALDLVSKAVVSDQIVLTIGYDIDNLEYKGETVSDHYGRKVPKPAHGSINLGKYTSLSSIIINKTMELYQKITDPSLKIRRITIAANHVILESNIKEESNGYDGGYEQMELFVNYEERDRLRREEKEKEEQEKSLQKAILNIHDKYGKNALLKGTNFLEGATTRERNGQVGGHKG